MSSNIVPFSPRGARHTERAVYTVAEVAELLSLSLGSTYTLVRLGEIPALKLGGRWVIPKRRFHSWLDELPEPSPEDIEREIWKEFR
ncbi:MAG: helix-turn-helix domain-containing protein [Carbonactinosporaceae bacterium]